MDLDKNLEIGDRIFAGEEVFARAFAVRSSFHLQLQFLLVELEWAACGPFSEAHGDDHISRSKRDGQTNGSDDVVNCK